MLLSLDRWLQALTSYEDSVTRILLLQLLTEQDVLSRGAAKRAFAGEDDGASEIARQMGDIESRRDSGILDELPGAYKDIHEIIAAQDNLVEVVQHLQTILCVKG